MRPAATHRSLPAAGSSGQPGRARRFRLVALSALAALLLALLGPAVALAHPPGPPSGSA